MMKNAGKILSLFLILALALGGCGSHDYRKDDPPQTGDSKTLTEAVSQYGFYRDEAEGYEAAGAQEGEQSPAEDGRKLVKTMSFTIETQEFDKSSAAVSSLASLLGGYIEDSSVSGNSYWQNESRTAQYVLRIPVSALAEFDGKVGDIGNIVSRSEKMKDITLDYTDTASRLKSLETQRDTLISLMEKAESLEDLLTVQDHLTDVEYELERYASQLRLYDNQVEYSSVTISLHEVRVYTEPQEAPDTFGERISAAFSRGLRSIGEAFSSFALFLAEYALGFVLFAAIAAAALLLIVRSAKKRRSRRALPAKENASAQSEQNGTD